MINTQIDWVSETPCASCDKSGTREFELEVHITGKILPARENIHITTSIQLCDEC